MAHLPNKSGLFDPRQFSEKQHFLIAYSGGADSTALLHFCAHHPALKQRIRAIHINHQLQVEANQWQKHCQDQCRSWQVNCVVACVTLKNPSENEARIARQTEFKKHLRANELLLTAHHQQDQVETVLFRLFRGSGLKGLGGIRKQNTLSSKYTFCRPILNVSKLQISEYLSKHHLSWVEDPSNQSDHYSRNHIRNRILPVISTYSFQANDLIESTANHLQNSHDLLMHLMPDDNPLALTDKVNATFLHHWLQKQKIAAPSGQQINDFLSSTTQAASHKQPSIHWNSFKMMAWRNKIYLLTPVTSLKNSTIKWEKQMQLPCGGFLNFSCHMPLDELQIAYGVQGERLKMSQHRKHKRIKKLHQEHQTTPWDKDITPYIYHQDQLLAVGNWPSESFDQLLAANKCQYSWQKPNQIL